MSPVVGSTRSWNAGYRAGYKAASTKDLEAMEAEWLAWEADWHEMQQRISRYEARSRELLAIPALPALRVLAEILASLSSCPDVNHTETDPT